MTLLYFPICVILAWIADRRLLIYKYMHKRYRADKRHGIVVEMEGDLSPKGIDVIMDGKLSDDTSSPGNSSSVTVSVQTGGEHDQNKDEVRKEAQLEMTGLLLQKAEIQDYYRKHIKEKVVVSCVTLSEICYMITILVFCVGGPNLERPEGETPRQRPRPADRDGQLLCPGTSEEEPCLLPCPGNTHDHWCWKHIKETCH